MRLHLPAIFAGLIAFGPTYTYGQPSLQSRLQTLATTNTACNFAKGRLGGGAASLDARVQAARSALACAQRAVADALANAASFQDQLAIKQVGDLVLAEAEAVAKQAEDENHFYGLTWGVGFGFSFSSREAISDAEIVNGVVRVKTQQKQQPRVLLEFHQFILKEHPDGGQTGQGPFVAVAASQDKLLSGVGFGWIYGKKSKDAKEGFSVGAGLMLDAKAKDLGPGFRKDAPPPVGETAVRFEEKSRWSGVIFVTRTF